MDVDGSRIGVGTAAPGRNDPDGIDNNNNGVIDECVIRKLETWYDPNAVDTPLQRTLSTVCRDVQWDPVTRRPRLVFLMPNADAGGAVYSAGEQNRVFVLLTLERQDPKFPRRTDKNFKKTLAQYIEVRN